MVLCVAKTPFYLWTASGLEYHEIRQSWFKMYLISTVDGVTSGDIICQMWHVYYIKLLPSTMITRTSHMLNQI